MEREPIEIYQHDSHTLDRVPPNPHEAFVLLVLQYLTHHPQHLARLNAGPVPS